RSKSTYESCVLEVCVAGVAIERRRIAREVCLDDVQVSVPIVVGGGNPHAGLRFAICAERTTSFDCNINKLSILLILIKCAGRRIVRHINIGPAVVIEVAGQNPETKRSARLQDSSSV